MDADKFGCFVANRRKELHMTQKDLAAKIHVTDKAVSKWERGLGFPDINTIEDLANALEISISELMRSERNTPAADNTATETPVRDDIILDTLQIAKDDMNERQKIVMYTFAGTTVVLSILQILLSIEWNGASLSMKIEIPWIAVLPGLILVLYGLICRIRGKKIKDIIPLGLCLLIIPLILLMAAFLFCGLFAV